MDYSPHKANELLSAMSAGTTVEDFCRKNGLLPAIVEQWCVSEPSFEVSLKQAYRMQAALFAEQVISIADNAQNIADDSYANALSTAMRSNMNPAQAKKYADRRKREELDVIKVRIDSRKWISGKLDPERWGSAPKPPRIDVSNVINLTVQNFTDSELREAATLQKKLVEGDVIDVQYTIPKEVEEALEELPDIAVAEKHEFELF